MDHQREFTGAGLNTELQVLLRLRRLVCTWKFPKSGSRSPLAFTRGCVLESPREFQKILMSGSHTQRFWNEVLFWIFSAKNYTRKLPFCFDSGSDTRFLSFLTTLVCLGYSFTSSFYCTFYNACSIHWSSFHLLPRILLAEAKCHLFGDAPLPPQKHSWNPGIVKRKYIHHWGPILPSWDWCPVREMDRSSNCSTRWSIHTLDTSKCPSEGRLVLN
jgi:hypothetical protein